MGAESGSIFGHGKDVSCPPFGLALDSQRKEGTQKIAPHPLRRTGSSRKEGFCVSDPQRFQSQCEEGYFTVGDSIPKATGSCGNRDQERPIFICGFSPSIRSFIWQDRRGLSAIFCASRPTVPGFPLCTLLAFSYREPQASSPPPPYLPRASRRGAGPL